MKNCFGMFGWEEFYRNRKNILEEYDKAFEYTKNRPVRTAHGKAVEAFIRKWLAEFIPKKWAVTSGYIIPKLYGYSEKLYHYDVIIYDQINAPILWTEGNSDDSEKGKSRAIPEKYVVGVIEIKSRFTTKSIKEMESKLSEINCFIDQFPDSFFSSGIFIDLKDDDNKKSTLDNILSFHSLNKFATAMILRWEKDESVIGNIVFLDGKDSKNDSLNLQHCENIADYLPELYILEDGNLSLPGGATAIMHYSGKELGWLVTKAYTALHRNNDKIVSVTWSHNGFTSYCITLLTLLEGLPFDQYNVNNPNFGHIFDKIDRKKAPIQCVTPEKGKPFLKLDIDKENERKFTINQESCESYERLTITFSIEIKNIGDIAAIISDDSFTTMCELDSGETTIKQVGIKTILDKVKKISEVLTKEKLEIPYRIVYYPVGANNDFCALEKIVKIDNKGIELV